MFFGLLPNNCPLSFCPPEELNFYLQFSEGRMPVDGHVDRSDFMTGRTGVVGSLKCHLLYVLVNTTCSVD